MATKPTPPIKKLVTLEDSTLIVLAQQPAILKEFAFLATIKSLASSKATGCSKCGSGRLAAQRSSQLVTVKQTIAGMGDDRKRRLKQLLNTEKVRITYMQGKQLIQRTF